MAKADARSAFQYGLAIFTLTALLGLANATQLFGVDGETGMTLYSGGNCTNVHQWSAPIAVNGRIVAGGDGHLCAWH